MRVFVSSTFVDLKPFRAAVREILLRLDLHPVMMEDFGAAPTEPSVAALERLASCELFVGVYARRYGTVPPGRCQSVTEAEFDRARELGMPMFCYRLDSSVNWPPDFIEGPPGAEQLARFMADKVDHLLRSTFVSPHALGAAVAADIGRFRAASPVIVPEPMAAATTLPALEPSLNDRIRQALTDSRLEGTPSIALVAVPAPPTTIRDLFRSGSAAVARVESPPTLREAGYGFDLSTLTASGIVRGQLRRSVIPEYKNRELWEDGVLLFTATAGPNFLGRGKQETIKINPLALAEVVYLFAVWSSEVWAHASPIPERGQYSIRLAGLNDTGAPAILSGGVLGSFAQDMPWSERTAPDSAVERSVAELAAASAGRVAYDLVRAVYVWFGHDETRIPYVHEVDGHWEIDPRAIQRGGTL
jgi:hypothetical protein